MKVDLLIFDIDGVLIDVCQSYREAIKQSVQFVSGREISNGDIEEIKKIPGFNNDWDVSYALAYEETNPEKIDRASERYIEIKNTFQKIYKNQKLYERENILISRATLEKLKSNAKLGIVTSRPRVEAFFALNKFIPEFFEENMIIAREDCSEEKPSPKPLLLLKDKSNTASALYVGDSINDSIAARKAGMFFASVNQKIPADFYIKNVNDVFKVMEMRVSEVKRETNETKISGKLNLDGSGKSKVQTGIGFFDHMLTAFSKQGLFDLEINAKGDLNIDGHHTVEDVGIVIGQLFKQALGEKRGINRYGFFILPMDETLALAAIDLDGRCMLVFNAEFESEKIGELETQLVEEFFLAFVRECRCSLNLKILDGKNSHHKVEALFKAFARSLRMACELDQRAKDQIQSTKGVI